MLQRYVICMRGTRPWPGVFASQQQQAVNEQIFGASSFNAGTWATTPGCPGGSIQLRKGVSLGLEGGVDNSTGRAPIRLKRGWK